MELIKQESWKLSSKRLKMPWSMTIRESHSKEKFYESKEHLNLLIFYGKTVKNSSVSWEYHSFTPHVSSDQHLDVKAC